MMTVTALIECPTRIDDDATRRQFLIGGLSAAALLAGCSDSGSDSSAGPSAGEGFPITIEHKYGSTEIPSKPDRVVTVDTSSRTRCWPSGWSRSPLLSGSAGIPGPFIRGLGMRWGMPRYPRCSARPTASRWRGSPPYDTLSKIAPTVVQPAGVPSFGMSWQDITRTVGRTVGQPARAEQMVAAPRRERELLRLPAAGRGWPVVGRSGFPGVGGDPQHARQGSLRRHQW